MEKEKAYFLGIDTSCYTTSCAVVDKEGTIVSEARRLLSVKPGARGLQQSNMVFQHTRALPELIESLTIPGPVAAVGVSAFPRREEGSYMPAFLVGYGQGRTLSTLLSCPLYTFSHQENHMLAALRLDGEIGDEPFYGLHVSGGTTELIYCIPQSDGTMETTLCGGTMDLHGGQFVDRIGVALGLSFPAGPALERLAETADSEERLPVAVKEGRISFGGPCSEAMRRIERGVNSAVLAKGIFTCIGQSLAKMLEYHWQQKPANRLIAVGGVMSNAYLRSVIEDTCKRHKVMLRLAEAKYSSDNATGVAFGASLCYKLARS